jgi:cytochrome P450
MSQFVPPYPERPREPLPMFAMMAAARRNVLAMFDKKCFEYQFFSTRWLTRRVFVCNSPDTVAQVFIALHDSFERKTPQIRKALTPLIGNDASFISDGPIWKMRRRIVAQREAIDTGRRQRRTSRPRAGSPKGVSRWRCRATRSS